MSKAEIHLYCYIVLKAVIQYVLLLSVKSRDLNCFVRKDKIIHPFVLSINVPAVQESSMAGTALNTSSFNMMLLQMKNDQSRGCRVFTPLINLGVFSPTQILLINLYHLFVYDNKP